MASDRVPPLLIASFVASFGSSLACNGGGVRSAPTSVTAAGGEAPVATGGGGEFQGTGGSADRGGARTSDGSGGASTGGNAGSSATGGVAGAADAGSAESGKRYGFTLDAVDDLANIVDSLSRLPKRALVRVVFDYPESPDRYRAAIGAIVPHADVVGQPSDSTYTKQMSVDEYRARFESYVSSFPEIDLWEACNECNGDWAGENTPAQTDAAFDVIKQHAKRVLYTPYWNESNCADTHGDYLAWTEKNISSKVKTGTDLVAVSIYGTDCAGPEPTYAELDAMFDRLAAMFPNAQLGIGEYGAKSASDKESVLRYYLDYSNPAPRYVFWGGYWYGHQDFVPATKPLWQVFADATR